MGCFVVPGATSLVAEAVTRILECHEAKKGVPAGEGLSAKTRLLANVGWAATAVVAVQHALNGEIATSWPFLTALETTASRAQLVHEIATEGVQLTAGVVLVWLGLLAYRTLRRRVAAPAENV